MNSSDTNTKWLGLLASGGLIAMTAFAGHFASWFTRQDTCVHLAYVAGRSFDLAVLSALDQFFILAITVEIVIALVLARDLAKCVLNSKKGAG